MPRVGDQAEINDGLYEGKRCEVVKVDTVNCTCLVRMREGRVVHLWFHCLRVIDAVERLADLTDQT